MFTFKVWTWTLPDKKFQICVRVYRQILKKMPSKECSLKRGRGGTELPGSPTGAACNSSNISFEWSSTILVLGRVLEGFSEGFAFLDWQFPLAVQHADLFCCSDALIFQSQCSLCSKSVHMEVQVSLGFAQQATVSLTYQIYGRWGWFPSLIRILVHIREWTQSSGEI